MCGLTAADAASPAADASITLMTLGNAACASAAMKIQPRMSAETRLTTKSFPVVGSAMRTECNQALYQNPSIAAFCCSSLPSFPSGILKIWYANNRTIVEIIK